MWLEIFDETKFQQQQLKCINTFFVFGNYIIKRGAVWNCKENSTIHEPLIN